MPKLAAAGSSREPKAGVALRACIHPRKKTPDGGGTRNVATQLHEVVANRADEIAGLRDSGMLASPAVMFWEEAGL